jgi:hypothetical protein
MCSPAIQDSFRRATTYSFGSICMGSLMVAIVQLLQSMVNRARRHGGQSMVLCILECLLYYIERIAKYFNKVSRMGELLLEPFARGISLLTS